MIRTGVGDIVDALRVYRRPAMLLLPRFEGGTFVREEEWKPAYLLGFVCEDREWRVDLGLTAALSDEAGLPDPLGELR